MEKKKWKIFLVEDDKVIAEEIKRHLEFWNYEIKIAEDFQNIFDEFKNFHPDLVLMDVTLPFYNGYHWCKIIRKNSKVPILFVSAADENLNLIMAMDLGADDYLTKPFELDLLQIKIRALLRRAYEYIETRNILYKDISLDCDKMIISRENKEIELTKNEFKILEILLEKPGKVVNRDEIIDKIWQSDSYIDDNTLTVNVMRLRKKLEDINIFELIKTKKGVGYYVPPTN
ncbi:MAG: response regulator transcription factor [Anaerococcus vaginalis]|uniref:response regulator transcription factor n=1 Tax=Peptoniphilaceae TaxID=1570339 RepID=UPI0029055AD5|nr:MULTISPECIES: response regulator transcription factor [Peptoniphilaceae]MDU1643116.1 response regulator transcription factor [Peptoniphilus harei]MDU1764293.1 response regulator transcription factor [Anaerococcus vaginalis]